MGGSALFFTLVAVAMLAVSVSLAVIGRQLPGRASLASARAAAAM